MRWLACALLATTACGRVDDAGTASDAASDTSSIADTSSPFEVGEDAALDAETVCRAGIDVECATWKACLPQQFDDDFGDVTTCVNALVPRCVAEVSLSGMKDFVGQLKRCDDVVTSDPDYTCRDFLRARLGGESPATCRITGTLPKNAACNQPSQCASGDCRFTASSCGQCFDSTVVAVGSACGGDKICEAGSVCQGTTCVPYAELGETCYHKACHWEQRCSFNKCVARPKIGESCTTNADCLAGAWCDSKTLLCAAVPNAGPGETCGNDPAYGSGVVRYCVHGYRCADPTDPTASVATCIPAKKKGEACAGSLVPESECAWPLQCIGGVCGEVPGCP